LEAFGDSQELTATDYFVGFDLELDPSGLMPDEGELVVAGIVKQGGGLASHTGERLSGRIDILGRDPQGPVLVTSFGDHERRMIIACLGELLGVAAGSTVMESRGFRPARGESSLEDEGRR
jgi:hypothetical protein